MKIFNLMLLALLCLSNCNEFKRTIDSVRFHNNEDALVEKMINPELYSGASTIGDYAIIVCYILYCKNEEASEGIGNRLYVFLKDHPEKWNEMYSCIKSLPRQDIISVENFFARIILFEYFCSSPEPSRSDLYQRFPFLLKFSNCFSDMHKNEDIYTYWTRTNCIPNED